MNFLRSRGFLLCLSLMLGIEIMSFAQTKSAGFEENVYYSGGFSTLERAFHKNMNFDINDGAYREYYLFFEIRLSSKSDVVKIVMLNEGSDKVTRSVYETLQKVDKNWKNETGTNQTVILPVFIVGERNEGNIGKPDNNWGYNFKKIKGVFFQPLVIPQYKEIL